MHSPRLHRPRIIVQKYDSINLDEEDGELKSHKIVEDLTFQPAKETKANFNGYVAYYIGALFSTAFILAFYAV